MKNLLIVLLVFMAGTSLYAAGEIYIVDGATHSTRDWSLLNAYAVSVRENGAGGDAMPHPNYGDTDFSTFWFKGDGFNPGPPITPKYVFPLFETTDFAGDYSAHMDTSVKLRMRTNNWYSVYGSQYAQTTNIRFIFDGIVGGVMKQVTIKIYPETSWYGWPQEVWNDVEVNLDGGLFTLTGSTFPSGSGNSLDLSEYSITAPEASEFWQNITGMRVQMQVQSYTDGISYHNWFDVKYLYIVAAPPTICEEALFQGYEIAGDLNNDCEVDFEDFSLLAAAWLDCIDPVVGACDQPWLP